MSETLMSSRPVYQGKVINVRVDTVELHNGKQASRDIVEHHGAIAVVALLDPVTVVLVRQYRQAAGKLLLEIPAGSIEIGEEPDACALRELREEIHFEAAEITKLFQSYVAPGYSTELIHTFVASDLSPNSKAGDDDEFIEIVTMPLMDAIGLIASGEIEDSKTIAGLLYVERLQSR